MTRQLMVYLVRYIAEHDCVERVHDPGDDRGKLVHLTERGRE